MVRSYDDEFLVSRKVDLETYLDNLLQHEEVRKSEELSVFLQEDERDSEIASTRSGVSHNKTNSETNLTSAISFILQPIMEKKIVIASRANFELRLHIKQSNLVVLWEFITEGGDIGMRVDFNDKPVKIYQRFDSHVKKIQGSFNPPSDGICILHWDNRFLIILLHFFFDLTLFIF